MPDVDVIVGRLGRARGLAGEVFVDLSTDSPKQRFRVGATLLADRRPLTVTAFHLQGRRALVRFAEVPDRETAESLTGQDLVARVDPAETTGEKDTYFDHQLVGLSALNPAGELVGRVVRVDHYGFQDTLALATDQGERLVPFVEALVPTVDLAGGHLVVRDIPGLLEETDEA